MKINCIAIDDEPLALDIITEYCKRIPFLDLLQTFDNAVDALGYLRENTVDLMFLDIEMEGLSGMQLLKTLKNKPYIVMITAYDQYAVQGFELDVDDYMLKPVSFERFIKGVNKVYERMQKDQAEKPADAAPIASQAEAEPACFFIKTETRMEKVNPADILYVEGMGDYWRIVTTGKKIMTLMNARGLEEMMPEPRFCRVHKSYFVAIDKIEFIERRSIKIGDIRIPVSDTYQKRFFELIEKNKPV
ncbi:MAG: LytTR family DNA-binding domain-containing protein [Bacteroides sp.]|jgi:DNA-binding LytR/AlgR family response regulator|nr:LytTR family DNA-binding domain-containing protein [Bacteroides sp.]